MNANRLGHQVEKHTTARIRYILFGANHPPFKSSKTFPMPPSLFQALPIHQSKHNFLSFPFDKISGTIFTKKVRPAPTVAQPRGTTWRDHMQPRAIKRAKIVSASNHSQSYLSNLPQILTSQRSDWRLTHQLRWLDNQITKLNSKHPLGLTVWWCP